MPSLCNAARTQCCLSLRGLWVRSVTHAIGVMQCIYSYNVAFSSSEGVRQPHICH
jgi:hypothetical protein